MRVSQHAVTEASVTEYQSLQDFVSRVSTSCSQVEDGSGQQTLSLVTFLEKTRDKTWTDMKGVLFARVTNSH